MVDIGIVQFQAVECIARQVDTQFHNQGLASSEDDELDVCCFVIGHWREYTLALHPPLICVMGIGTKPLWSWIPNSPCCSTLMKYSASNGGDVGLSHPGTNIAVCSHPQFLHGKV